MAEEVIVIERVVNGFLIQGAGDKGRVAYNTEIALDSETAIDIIKKRIDALPVRSKKEFEPEW